MSRSAEPALPEERTIYVANFADEVDEEILEELFTQTGPVVKVILRDVKDSNARFALVEFEDEATVLFAIELMNGVKLFDKEIQVKPRNNTKQEELYRRKRGEIEERIRSSQAARRRSHEGSHRDYHRDRSPHRDQDRYSRNSRSAGSSSSRDSWQQPRHQPRHQGNYQAPPPPPQLMGNSWRQGNPFNPPNLLPHQLFVNVMQNQRNYNPRHQAPPPPPQYHHQNTQRRQDRRGSDRHGANHYDQQQQQRRRY